MPRLRCLERQAQCSSIVLKLSGAPVVTALAPCPLCRVLVSSISAGCEKQHLPTCVVNQVHTSMSSVKVVRLPRSFINLGRIVERAEQTYSNGYVIKYV